MASLLGGTWTWQQQVQHLHSQPRRAEDGPRHFLYYKSGSAASWNHACTVARFSLSLVASLSLPMLATQLIEARARQEGRVSLYDWIVYKRGSKARERKGEERKHRSKLYTILWSRDGNLR